MNMTEEILERLRSYPHLFFIEAFLKTFPRAELFLVGGALRDFLLHRFHKEMDVDFVVQNLPASELETFLKSHGEVDFVGKTFGVYKFRPKGFQAEKSGFIDIALPRKEFAIKGSQGGYREFDIQSDPKIPIDVDLSRRDFTINAMAFSLRSHVLIDPFNGQQDLATKTIQTVGQPLERFSEDLSRILRAIRFASTLGFEIDPETFDAIKTKMPDLNLKNSEGVFVVPRETIGEELAKAFLANTPLTVKLLRETTGLEVLFPHVSRLQKKDSHYLTPLSHAKKCSLELAIILLLRGLSSQEIKETIHATGLGTNARASRWRIETDQIEWVILKLNENLTTKSVLEMRASKFEKYFGNGRGKLHLEALRHLGKESVAEIAVKRLLEIHHRWKAEENETIPPLLTGDDIIRSDIPAGPHVREFLEKIRDLQLDGTILTREAALTWLKKEAGKIG